jgi:hypothetical protein
LEKHTSHTRSNDANNASRGVDRSQCELVTEIKAGRGLTRVLTADHFNMDDRRDGIAFTVVEIPAQAGRFSFDWDLKRDRLRMSCFLLEAPAVHTPCLLRIDKRKKGLLQNPPITKSLSAGRRMQPKAARQQVQGVGVLLPKSWLSEMFGLLCQINWLCEAMQLVT